MMKWLLLAVVVVAVLWWLGRGRRGTGAASPSSDAAGPAQKPAAKTAAPEPMVDCAHCGMLLPQADALSGPAADEHYCSEPHRRAGPRKT